MERRHVQFALIAFAIIFGSQLLQIWLFPRPPAEPGDAELPFAAAKQEAGAEGAFRAADKPAESAQADGAAEAAAEGAAPTEEAAPTGSDADQVR